jgi:hypothetical protein
MRPPRTSRSRLSPTRVSRYCLPRSLPLASHDVTSLPLPLLPLSLISVLSLVITLSLAHTAASNHPISHRHRSQTVNLSFTKSILASKSHIQAPQPVSFLFIACFLIDFDLGICGFDLVNIWNCFLLFGNLSSLVNYIFLRFGFWVDFFFAVQIWEYPIIDRNQPVQSDTQSARSNHWCGWSTDFVSSNPTQLGRMKNCPQTRTA